MVFTGDAAGIKTPGSPLVGLPAPPPEFDREAWQATIKRLRSKDIQTLYLTHFGPTPNEASHWDDLRQLLEDATEFVGARIEADMPRDELVQAFLVWNQVRAADAGLSEATILQYMTANPLEMSVDGIRRYWHKRQEG